MSGANVFIHATQFPDAIQRELVRSLRTRCINHKFHYETTKQAQKWLALHEAHSPARNDTQCLATYDRAFAAVAKRISAKSIHVVGLGCGGGQKDARLLELLARNRHKLAYTACDVSVPLVLVARERALKFVADGSIQPFVCDLALTRNFNALLSGKRGERRLITFFGMIPNFEPRVILPKLAKIVRPGDSLLFSANLVPGPDEDASMRRILPQYDNELTREWLLTLLLDLGFERGDGRIEFSIETKRGLRRFIARFHSTRSRKLRVGDRPIAVRAGESIQLFFSYRHTPQTIQRLLAKHELRVVDRWITESAEEGVFLCAR
jgi:uncharacterized SAM-dependent methyltransferase